MSYGRRHLGISVPDQAIPNLIQLTDIIVIGNPVQPMQIAPWRLVQEFKILQWPVGWMLNIPRNHRAPVLTGISSLHLPVHLRAVLGFMLMLDAVDRFGRIELIEQMLDVATE